MYVFAIAKPEGRIEEAEVRALAGTQAEAADIARGASGACVLGHHRALNSYPLSLASVGHRHAAVAGDILEPLEDEPDFAQAPPASLLLRRLARGGLESLGRINGLFCALIWDDEKRSLTALSDRVGGFQTLYYAQQAGRLAVSSRLQALLALPWVGRELDPVALHELLATGYVLPPSTLLAGIRKLGPGEALVLERGGPTLRLLERATPNPTRGGRRLAPEILQEHIERSLARAAARPGRRAYLLSGGIDSSTLVTLAARVDPQPLRAFTGAFARTAQDESGYARLLARQLGCEQVEIDLAGPEQLEALPQVLWHLGEPTHDFSVLPTYHLLRRVAQEAEAVVSGDGPDHLFCRYHPLAAKRLLSPVARRLPRLPAGLTRLPGLALAEKIRRAAEPDLLTAYREIYRLPAWGLSGDRLLQALIPSLAHARPAASGYLAERRFRGNTGLPDLLADLTYVDLHVDGSFGVFQKVGAMARAHGLLAREPFLDREVSDAILSLAPGQWVSGSWWQMLRSRAASKFWLKHELGPRLLPAELIRKPKHGFTPPLAGWLRERLRHRPAREWMCPALKTGDLIDVSVVEHIVAEHGSQVRDWSLVLFLLLSVDVWARMTLMEREAGAPAWTLKEMGI